MKIKELFICSKDVLKILAIFYISIILTLIFQDFFHINNDDLMFSISLLLSLFIFYFIFKIKNKNLFKYVELHTIKINIKIISLITLFLIFYFFIESYLYDFLNLPTSSNDSNFNLKDLFCLFHLIIIAPLVEEIIFRGIIFKRLKKSMNIYIALIIQSIIFSLMHVNLIQSVSAIFMGFILGFIYYKTNNLTFPILVHSLHNFILLIYNLLIIYFI